MKVDLSYGMNIKQKVLGIEIHIFTPCDEWQNKAAKPNFYFSQTSISKYFSFSFFLLPLFVELQWAKCGQKDWEMDILLTLKFRLET